jgi:hypothetical protein
LSKREALITDYLLFLSGSRGEWQFECRYSIFTSALYRNLTLKWLFPLRGPQRQVFVAGVEVKATFHAAVVSTYEVKML